MTIDYEIKLDLRESNNCLYAEASEIGLAPDQIPNSLILNGQVYIFSQTKTDSRGEVYAWEYRNWFTLKRIVIWND